MTKYLRHKEDLRSLGFVLLVLILQGVALTINLHTTPVLLIITLTCLLAFLGYVCHTINHNHIHVPIFQTRKQNNVFSIFLSIAQGLSSKSLIVTHNLNHHVHTANENDWFHSRHAGKGPGILRLFRYVMTVWLLIAKERPKDPSVKLPKHLARQEIVENIGLLLFSILSLYLNWKAFVFMIFPAWMMASFFITAINLLQHEGCDPESKYGHSRNYSSRIGNWIFFNGGYHGAHHSRPSVHWSKLPELHQQIEHEIPEGLNSPSMVGMIVKDYLLKLS